MLTLQCFRFRISYCFIFIVSIVQKIPQLLNSTQLSSNVLHKPSYMSVAITYFKKIKTTTTKIYHGFTEEQNCTLKK